MDGPADPDLIYGMPAIAKALDLTVRQARHLEERGALPTFRILSTVCARRSSLNAWLAEQEAKARRTEGAAA